MKNGTCISVKENTHAELILLGKKNESFDDVVQKLLKFYKEHNIKK